MLKTQYRYTTLVILLVVIAVAAGAVLVRKHRTAVVQSLPGVEAAPWALHTVSLQRAPLSREFLALAKVVGVTEITISSQIAGTIEAMGPREGAKVVQGEVLARISVRELQEQLAGLQAELNSSQADVTRTQDEFDRQAKLIGKKLTSTELFESKKTAALAARQRVNTLQRQIAALQIRIGYGTVAAPKDALVAHRQAEPGDNARPGTELYRLTVNSASRLQITLPQQILEQVHLGTGIILDYASRQLRVSVSRIFPALDSRALGTVEADLDSMPFGLGSGSRIPARVILDSVDDALSVPHQAIIQRGELGFVFRVVDSDHGKVLKKVDVRTGLNTQLAVELISSELEEGDELIVAHESILLQLQDDDPVIAVPARVVDGQDTTSQYEKGS
ncbi:MAG: efflux RND transporter periplasmic adaptor subunit [Halioglobus sp.]